MKTEEYIRETTMTERDRLWEEITETFGSKGAKEIDEFFDWAKEQKIDDTERFEAEINKFKDSVMPGSPWWDEYFETYFYDIEYCYFADVWLKEHDTDG